MCNAIKLFSPVIEVIILPRELKTSSLLCICYNFVARDETKNFICTLTESNIFLQTMIGKTDNSVHDGLLVADIIFISWMHVVTVEGWS